MLTRCSSDSRGSSKRSSNRNSLVTDRPTQRDKGEDRATSCSVQVGGVYRRITEFDKGIITAFAIGLGVLTRGGGDHQDHCKTASQLEV